MQKHKNTKLQKFKTMAVPIELWQRIRLEAAKKGIKIYQELEQTYGNKTI